MGDGESTKGTSVIVTTSATPTITNIGFKTTSILFRSLSTNTDNVTINLGAYGLLGGSIIIRPAETISIDINQILILKVLRGEKLDEEDYITQVKLTGAASNPVIYIDALDAS